MEIKKHGADQLLVCTVLLLTAMGLVTLYTASYAFAERFYGNGLYFFFRQVKFATAGLVLFFIVSHIELTWIRGRVLLFFVGSCFLLCVLVFIPSIGKKINGASRWIELGGLNGTTALVSIQPSEFVKLALPLYLAHFFAKKQEKQDDFFSGVLPPILILCGFLSVIFLQNNFSTACFLLFNSLVVFFIAGLRPRFFLGMVGFFLPLAVLFALTKEHRFKRIAAYINPLLEPRGIGYQRDSSIRTIHSGGFWGKGIGQGTRKVAGVSEIHSDFIFAGFAEEGGVIGVFLIFALFAFFAFAAYKSALMLEDPFKKIVSFGLATSILSQTLLNIAVAVGALPVTGITLPFFSAGGSSLLVTLLMAGILVNNSRYTAGSKYIDVEVVYV